MKNLFPRDKQYSPMRKRWRIIAIVLTTIGFSLMAGFRLILAFNGLRVMDLWNAGNSLTSPTNSLAACFAKTGLPLATVSFNLAIFTIVYCIALAVAALIKRDMKTSATTTLCLVFSVVAGTIGISTRINYHWRIIQECVCTCIESITRRP